MPHSPSPSLQVSKTITKNSSVENVKTEITQLKLDIDRISHPEESTNINELDATTALKSAMEKMPILQDRKRTMDMHMSLAVALFDAVGKRQLDQFFILEESIQKQVKNKYL